MSNGDPLDVSQSSDRPEDWTARVEAELESKDEQQVRRMLHNRLLRTDGDLALLQQRYRDPREHDLDYDEGVFEWEEFKRSDEKNAGGGNSIWLLTSRQTGHVLGGKGGIPSRNVYGSNEKDGIFFPD
jgi:hypothetical protein